VAPVVATAVLALGALAGAVTIANRVRRGLAEARP
jgi:hypothetical protein